MTVWIAVVATGLGCYALKLAGLVVPQRVLGNPRVRRFSELIPVALLTALIAVQALAHGRALELDGPRLAGMAVAVVALLLRAPFLIVLAARPLRGRTCRRGPTSEQPYRTRSWPGQVVLWPGQAIPPDPAPASGRKASPARGDPTPYDPVEDEASPAFLLTTPSPLCRNFVLTELLTT
jgi:uncharacterized membrane protein